jgi:ribokinase
VTLSFATDDRRWDIVGVGDIDVDLYLGVSALAGPDEKVGAALLGEHPGGMIANVCCAASRVGSPTAMIGVVGEDVYGRIAVAGLEEFGVDTSLVRVRADGRTFFCVIMLDASGEKALTAVDTDCHLPSRDDIDPGAFASTRIVHIMGDDLQTATWTAAEARARGARVSLDLEASTAVHGLEALSPLLASTDIVFMNVAGCVTAFGRDLQRAMSVALDMGPTISVLTRGAGGVLAVSIDTAVTVPALNLPVVDTTGAGDCFIGAFLNRLVSGWDLEGATRFATAAAALSIGSVGSRTALPHPEQVSALMDKTTALIARTGAT